MPVHFISAHSHQIKDVILLGVETNDEGRNINNLLANSDVPLTDENTGVVNGLCKSTKYQLMRTLRCLELTQA